MAAYWLGRADGSPFYPMCFKRYLYPDNGAGWGNWEDCWGLFKGNPAVLVVGPNRT